MNIDKSRMVVNRAVTAPAAKFLGERGLAKILMLCLIALATNAVLIQTVVPEESALKNIVRACVLIVAAIAMVLNNSRVPVAIAFMIVFSIILLALRQNPDLFSYVFIFMLVPALLSIKERSLQKAFLVGSLGSLALVFVFVALGITHNQVLDVRNRSTYGTNGVPFFYNLVYGAFTMLVMYSQKYLRRRRFLVILASVAVTTYFYLETDARSGYFSFLGFIFLLFLVPKLSRSGAFRFVTTLLPVLFLLASFYIASLSENELANRLLSQRPILFRAFLDNINLGDVLFSTSVKHFDRVVTIVDNSYLHLLIGGGVVLCGTFLFIFGRAVSNLFRQGRFAEISFVIATCAYFNTESILLRMENLFVIYFWYLILRYSIVPTGPSSEPPADASRTTRHDQDRIATSSAERDSSSFLRTRVQP